MDQSVSMSVHSTDKLIYLDFGEVFNNIDEELKYLREKVDALKTPKVKSYDGDIIKLQNEIDKLKGEISRLEKLLKDPLADFK